MQVRILPSRQNIKTYKYFEKQNTFHIFVYNLKVLLKYLALSYKGILLRTVNPSILVRVQVEPLLLIYSAWSSLTILKSIEIYSAIEAVTV